MQTTPRAAPFNPSSYTSGKYVDLIRGMEETLRRWDEVDPTTALSLPAYLHEGVEADGRLRAPLFDATVSDRATEQLAAMLSADDVIKRARADGVDANGILRQLRAGLRPSIEETIKYRRLGKGPRSFLLRLLG